MHPREGVAYAVVTGTYCGEMLIFIGELQNDFTFLSVPKNINRNIPKNKFDIGLKHGIVEVVEQVPKEIYEIVKAQFIQNENSNN